MHLRPFLVMTSLATAALLSGCLIPEHFSAKIDIQPDASLDYSYEGTAIDPMAMLKMQRQGILSDKEQQSLAAEAQKLRQNPDVKKAVYMGKARYQLEMEGRRKAGEPLKLLDMLSVQSSHDGVMTIAVQPVKRKEKADLAQMGVLINGSLRVNVPEGAEVISHNANNAPASGSGSYTWRIGEVGVRPEIKLRFNP